MSGYTILKIFCSFIVFLVLPSVGLPEEVNLKIDAHVLLISFVLNLNSGELNLVCFFLQSRFLFLLNVLQSRTLSVPESFLFVSTLDGTMHAVKKQTGEIRWSLKEGEN